jgi:hypothetical protein
MNPPPAKQQIATSSNHISSPSRHINQIQHIQHYTEKNFFAEKTYVIVRRLLAQIRWSRLEATAKWTWPASVDRLCDVEESPFSSLSFYIYAIQVIMRSPVNISSIINIVNNKEQSRNSISLCRMCVYKGKSGTLLLNGAER